MKIEPIENLYFNWLCAKVLEKNGRIYYDLLKILHSTEFVVWIQADQHRTEDGVELRINFFRETGMDHDVDLILQPCSVLEILISFAERASFQTDIPMKEWFWTFMENLQLDQFRQVSESDIPIITDILETFMFRTYDSMGNGGMFPMNYTEKDQREVEIWYQFNEYLSDHGLVL